MDAQLPKVGKPEDRADGRIKVTGKARYAAEFTLPGLLHAILVQSTIAKGRIAELDTAVAEQAPGVVAVLTHKNAPRFYPASTRYDGSSQCPGAEFQLRDDDIRFFGQNVALVVADTLERAQDAAARVKVRYEEAVHATDLRATLDRAAKPTREDKRLPADSSTGDFETAFSRAAVKIDVTYTTAQENHNPMEPHATVAVWEDGKLTVYDATQSVSGVRHALAATLGVSTEDVRVVCPFVGGGFGCKAVTWPHVVLAAAAARHVSKPVKLVVSRHQMFTSVGYRSPTVQQVQLGATREGKLVAMRHTGIGHSARYAEFVEPVSVVTRMMYACPTIVTSHRVVPLDVHVPTYMRAPGDSTGSIALEVAMDELARACDIDPLEIRLRNYAEEHPTEKKPWSSKSLETCYRVGAEKFGWAKRPPGPCSMTDGRQLIGWGMASAAYPVSLLPARARVTVRADGTALVESATQDLGTGSYTVFAQLTAELLGLPVERVSCRIGDTLLPPASGSGGSSTVGSVGSAVWAAVRNVRSKLVALAVADAESPLRGIKPEGVTVADGQLVATDDATKRESLVALLTRTGPKQIGAEGESTEVEAAKTFAMHAFGAVFAEVAVDPELCTVRVRRVVGAYAAGRILNAKTARSQFIGGIIFGIGTALLERTVTDHRTGTIVTRDLAEYLVPVHADMPDIDIVIVPEDDPHTNAIGTKGIGEIGNVGSAAAVANAVFHATGRCVRDFPITPEQLL